jgi:adenine-specific DNA-methyltransferase
MKDATLQPEKLDLRSHDIAADKVAELLRLFPEIRTEGGKLDFERLKLALGEAVDVGRERYGMNWPGKAECFKTIQAPSVGTLRPCPEESVNFDTTENLIIEGDNLEALKLLQKSYLGKVKVIYIDPPYNTGNDFIYPDDYTESLHTYLQYTGQVDAEGRRFGTNTDADGRFHSKWLNMMYPRLYLARNLLREDGAIFISIDDHEVDNLRKLCNEVFGEENFVATILWQKVFSPKNTARQFSEDHDYIVCYARNTASWTPVLLPRGEAAQERYVNPDSDSRGPWSSSDLTARNYYAEGQYEVKSKSGKVFKPAVGNYWRVKQSKFEELDKDGRIWWGENGGSMPRLKRFLSEVKEGVVPQTLWKFEEVGHTQESKKELIEYVGFENTDNVIDSVKPTRLVKKLLKIGTQPMAGDIVLDFFLGTGTTAHAVLALNAEDGGNRRFIGVQLPEPLITPESGLRTIADVARRRVSRVVDELSKEAAQSFEFTKNPSQNLGFRVFKLAESNFTTWDAQVPHEEGTLLAQLEKHVDHIREGREPDDILYELLLKSGFPLTTPIEKQSLAGKSIYCVAGGALVICLEQALTLELIRAIAALKPERVVCLDEGFAGNDQLKANAVQTFKTKGVTSFKTV